MILSRTTESLSENDEAEARRIIFNEGIPDNIKTGPKLIGPVLYFQKAVKHTIIQTMHMQMFKLRYKNDR